MRGNRFLEYIDVLHSDVGLCVSALNRFILKSPIRYTIFFSFSSLSSLEVIAYKNSYTLPFGGL